MRPFMGEGDLVIVEPVSWEAIAVGDVITYRSDDKFPTRRVVEIDRDGGTLTLRVDALPEWPDFLVRREDVIGRAAVRLRHGARLDRHVIRWRWAAYRAVAWHRLARLTATGGRLVRGGFSRLTKALYSR
jgi:hypothetical protein